MKSLMKEIAWYRIDTSVTKFSSLFPQKERLRLSPYLNGKLEILLSSPKRRCLQNGTFEEKLSFRQNSLSLGFSYGKAAEKQSWESITEERVHHTLPRRGSSAKGLAKDEKNGGHKRNELPSKLSLEKGFFCVKLVVVLQTVREENESLQTLPGRGFLRTKDGCMRKERAPSNSPWRGSFAREKDWFLIKW